MYTEVCFGKIAINFCNLVNIFSNAVNVNGILRVGQIDNFIYETTRFIILYTQPLSTFTLVTY